MKITRIIGLCLVLTGLGLNIYYMVNKRNNIIKENNKIEATLKKEVNYRYIDNSYDAILSIPKINLRKGIYSINDRRNNIEENIMIHKDSIYPDHDNSNIILIAHSGSGDKAIFKDLKYMNEDSLVEFYYNHTKYVYKIDNIYCIEKSGKAVIKKNSNKKTITLITCDSKDKTKQVVYIGYLIDEIKY